MLDEAGYSNLSKSIDHIESATRLLTNPRLADSGLTAENLQALIKGNRNGQNRSSDLKGLTDGLNVLILQGTKFDNIDALIGDLNKAGTNFALGAGYTLRALTTNRAVLQSF